MSRLEALIEEVEDRGFTYELRTTPFWHDGHPHHHMAMVRDSALTKHKARSVDPVEALDQALTKAYPKRDPEREA